jgi:hypothetical protein
MATVKMSLGSIFGVVTSTASAAVSIADAIDTSAQALATEVQHMAAKLAEDNKLDLVNHKLTAKDNASQALAQSRTEILKWCNKSQENLDMFNQAKADIEEALASSK